jgi:hypothetical protein
MLTSQLDMSTLPRAAVVSVSRPPEFRLMVVDVSETEPLIGEVHTNDGSPLRDTLFGELGPAVREQSQELLSRI